MPATKTKRKVKWGEVIDGTRYYPFHKKQREVLESTARITAAIAGTGGGKTCLAPHWLLRLIEKNKGKGRYLVVSPTYKIFKQSGLLDAWTDLVEGTAVQGTFNKTDKIYTTANGAEIYFRSGDDPDSLEGGQYDGLVLDEAAKLSYEAWVKSRARVGQKQAPILIVTTPDVNAWLYTEIQTQADAGDPAYKVVRWATTDNPTYSKAEIESMRKLLPDGLFRRRYLGEFASLDGLVYETLTACTSKTVERLPYAAVRVCGAIDWGYDPDPCAVLVGVQCSDGKTYIVEELYERRMGDDELSLRLKQLERKWGVDVWWCDSSGKKDIADLTRRGITAKKRKVPDIETGIAMVDTRLRGGYLKIFECCRNVIEESKQYQRKSDRAGNPYATKFQGPDHALDALRYLISSMFFNRVVDSPLEVEDEAGQKDRLRRLGLVSDDPEEQRILEQKAEEKRHAEWFKEMIYADDDGEFWKQC